MTLQLFLSVGSRFPMDRLIKIMDNYVAQNPHWSGEAQTGESSYRSRHLKTQSWYDANTFNSKVSSANAFISHAGMGNILLARELNKPIIIMARKAEFGEHINNHQIGTVKGFRQANYIYAIENEEGLPKAMQWASTYTPHPQNNPNKMQLLSKLSQFVDQS